MRKRKVPVDTSTTLRAFVDLANEREGLLLLVAKFLDAISAGTAPDLHQERLVYIEKRLELIDGVMKMVVGDSGLTDCPESPRKRKRS